MSIDREDSKTAFRIAISLSVKKLQQFFNFDNFQLFHFQLFLLLPKSPWKIRPDGTGKHGTLVFVFELPFQNVISSLSLV